MCAARINIRLNFLSCFFLQALTLLVFSIDVTCKFKLIVDIVADRIQTQTYNDYPIVLRKLETNNLAYMLFINV